MTKLNWLTKAAEIGEKVLLTDYNIFIIPILELILLINQEMNETTITLPTAYQNLWTNA